MKATPSRYDGIAIALHWIIGLGIVVLGSVELIRHELPRGGFLREGLKALHGPAGTILFALILLRILWRLSHAAPAEPSDTPAWQTLASKLTHALLYAMMLAIPVFGMLTLFSQGKPIDFGIFQITSPWGQAWPELARKGVKSIHEFLGEAILVLSFVHALAALWHHYVMGDEVLLRMLPRRD